MKFVDLAMGQQFELEGEVYVRTGPLVASHSKGNKQRFMARYVTVKPVGEVADTAPHTPITLSADHVNRAAEIYYTQCLSALEQLDETLPAGLLGAVRKQIEEAHHIFLDTLNKT